MQGIEFEEDKSFQLNPGANKQTATLKPSKPSVMTSFIFKLGVNDPTLANHILLGAAAFFSGVAIFIYAGILSDSTPPKMTADQERVFLEMQNPTKI